MSALDPSVELFVVGDNIDRYTGYRSSRGPDAPLMRVCQGIYTWARRPGASDEDEMQRRDRLFQLYGIRIAKYLFPKASLSFNTAWLREPRQRRIWVTGQYQYLRPLFPVEGDKSTTLKRHKELMREPDSKARLGTKEEIFAVVQSIGKVSPRQRLLHTKEKYRDKLGTFYMLTDTPELTLLNLQTSGKYHVNKYLSEPEEDALVRHLLAKHGSPEAVLGVLRKVAKLADRQPEFKRAVNLIYKDKFLK